MTDQSLETGTTAVPSDRREVEAAWHALAVVQASVMSLEETATRVAAAQVAGFVALWTQLYTFESGPPRALAWTAWGLLLAAVISLAPVVTPRRLATFWTRIMPATGKVAEQALTFDAELAVVRELIDAFARQRERMFRGLRVSIAVSLVGLVLIATAYVLEKAFYEP